MKKKKYLKQQRDKSIHLVEHAQMRQEYIMSKSKCKSISSVRPKATEPQAVHDEYLQYCK